MVSYNQRTHIELVILVRLCHYEGWLWIIMCVRTIMSKSITEFRKKFTEFISIFNCYDLLVYSYHIRQFAGILRFSFTHLYEIRKIPHQIMKIVFLLFTNQLQFCCLTMRPVDRSKPVEPIEPLAVKNTSETVNRKPLIQYQGKSSDIDFVLISLVNYLQTPSTIQNQCVTSYY